MHRFDDIVQESIPVATYYLQINIKEVNNDEKKN